MDDDINKTDDMDDLEAQLSALGIFGGDDDDDGLAAPDPFEGFNFGDDDDDPFESMGGVAAPPPAAIINDDEDDLERQLELLLNADKAADESFEIKDVSVTSKQMVYDPEVDGMGSVQYVKGTYSKEDDTKEKMFANISAGKMIATFLIGFLLISAGAATVILAHAAVSGHQGYIEDVAHFRPVEVPVGTANNANIIFVNERAYIGELPFTITRITAAFSGTFVYFEEHFNPEDYYILLFNQARNLYARTDFGITAAPGTGTVLRFAPLSRNALFLSLHIQCRQTAEYARFSYRLTAPPIHSAPVLINRPVTVMGEMSGLTIRHAVFDSGSSTIHFSYSPEPHEAGFRLNMRERAPLVVMRDVGSLPHPLTNEDTVVYFDEFGLMLGTAVFGPIFTLESNVDIVFNDLTYFHPYPEIYVLPEQLFGNDQWHPLPNQVGPFRLMLEGMAQQGTRIVLTLHGLDQTGRRRPVDMEITLRVTLEDGEIVDMPGIVNVSIPEAGRGTGTDVVFDMRPYGEQLRDVHVENYSLIVHWVEYEVPSVSVPIGVSQFFNMVSMRRYAVERAVTEAFDGLLSYKSGEVSREGIVGLAPALRNALLDGIFAPAEFEGRAMYDVTISTGDLLSNYDYAAIVEVMWTAGETGEGLMYFRDAFKVIAHSQDGIWTIVSVSRL